MTLERDILADLCFARGQDFHRQLDYNQAAYWYRNTLDVVQSPQIHEAMGYALVMMQEYERAIPHWTEAMHDIDKMKQDLAQYNRGLCYLMIGDYINGFKDYDTRMRMGTTQDILRKKIGTRPMWDGSSCDHLLVYGEQGMGDLFMFCRFIPELIKRNVAKRITFEVPSEMVKFMKYNFPQIDVVGMTDNITQADEHVLLISLARIFGITKQTVPHLHLKAESEYIKKWEKISRLSGRLKVGLCFAGRSVANQDIQVAEWNARRSIPLKQLEPVLKIPDISFVSLQKGVDEEQLKNFPYIHDFGSEIRSWSDTAGIMSHLDMVISIDSGPVHLAGALGKPTLLLNHKMTCWRWGLTEETSPWYNSIVIARQQQEGDWSYPVEQAYKALQQIMDSRRAA